MQSLVGALLVVVAAASPAPAAPGASLPPGTVVIAVSGVDDTSSDIVALAPSGEREVLGSLEHARGKIPKGALLADGDGVAVGTTSEVLDGTHTVVEVTRKDGARRIVATGAVETQPVAVAAGGALFVVREDPRDPTAFTVGRADAPPAQLVRYRGSWLTPASVSPSSSSSPAYLAIALDGRSSIVALRSGGAEGLDTRADLGAGRYRSAVVVGGDVLVEREIDRDRAELLVFPSGGGAAAPQQQAVYAGLHGMDPKACGGDAVAFGNGKKHAGVVVARVAGGKLADERALEGQGAGVASVLACGVVEGEPLVVAWLSKGAALPGELWAFSAEKGARRLLEPAVGSAVEVYGIVGGDGVTR